MHVLFLYTLYHTLNEKYYVAASAAAAWLWSFSESECVLKEFLPQPEDHPPQVRQKSFFCKLMFVVWKLHLYFYNLFAE